LCGFFLVDLFRPFVLELSVLLFIFVTFFVFFMFYLSL